MRSIHVIAFRPACWALFISIVFSLHTFFSVPLVNLEITRMHTYNRFLIGYFHCVWLECFYMFRATPRQIAIAMVLGSWMRICVCVCWYEVPMKCEELMETGRDWGRRSVWKRKDKNIEFFIDTALFLVHKRALKAFRPFTHRSRLRGKLRFFFIRCCRCWCSRAFHWTRMEFIKVLAGAYANANTNTQTHTYDARTHIIYPKTFSRSMCCGKSCSAFLFFRILFHFSWLFSGRFKLRRSPFVSDTIRNSLNGCSWIDGISEMLMHKINK